MKFAVRSGIVSWIFLNRRVYFVVLRECMEGLMPPGVRVKNRVKEWFLS